MSEENETLDNSPEEELKVYRDTNFLRAHKYRPYGGKVAYLVSKKEGFGDFMKEHITKNTIINNQDFADLIVETFPDWELEEYPSPTALSVYANSLNKVLSGKIPEGGRQPALAMRNDVRNMMSVQNLNFFEEEQKLYDKSKMLLRMVEDIVIKSYEMVKKMAMPPDFFWKAIENYQRVLEQRGQRLAKLDDLCIRYNYMPPKRLDPKTMIAMQQNSIGISMNADVEKIINSLEITNDEDLYNDNFFATKVKQASSTIFGDRQDIPDETGFMEE